jgi:hypothetical protein
MSGSDRWQSYSPTKGEFDDKGVLRRECGRLGEPLPRVANVLQFVKANPADDEQSAESATV